jgi:predicted component of type VI protein secretion system
MASSMTPSSSGASPTGKSQGPAEPAEVEVEEVNHENGNFMSVMLLTNFDPLFRLGAERQLEMSGTPMIDSLLC